MAVFLASPLVPSRSPARLQFIPISLERQNVIKKLAVLIFRSTVDFLSLYNKLKKFIARGA